VICRIIHKTGPRGFDIFGSMKCIGCDVFVISKDGIPKFPKGVGTLKLEFISNRGSVLPADGQPDFLLTDWYRARYRAESEISDQEIVGLVRELPKTCHWEKLQKLYSVDGNDQFSGLRG